MSWRGAPRTAPTTPQPAARTAGRVTLEDVLRDTGVEGKATVTAADMVRLREELKEENPLDVSQIIRDVSAPVTGVLSETALRTSLQDFANFVPPDKLRQLPKLYLAINAATGEGGHYNPSTKSIVLSKVHTATAERRRAVMFHEAMHWLHMEGDKGFQKAIADHFNARTKGEAIQKLAPYDATGKRDKWYDAYAGRIYENTPYPLGTEVPTRYIEWLTMDPATMAEMWNDRDFRETMTIVLRSLF
jgi:hypothetical protein